MYKIKDVAKRGVALAAAMSLLTGIGTSLLPGFASADALNPLTNRTLLLSSSSPGWSYTDGSGNTTYAPPNSGANGKQTGETFGFKVSTNSTGGGAATVKAFTLQYCTSAAGQCQAPGNNTGNKIGTNNRGADTTSTSDFNVVTASPTEVSALPVRASGIVLADNSEGNFAVTVGGVLSPGWTMSTQNLEDNPTTQTGKNNYIKLVNSTGITPAAGAAVKLIFYGTNTNYLTNPGYGAFFVKINDYNSDTTQNFRDNYPTAATPQNVVDGGVTVANIMNQSIQIQTKVLETMDFSVGTVDPNTVPVANLAGNAHGQCDAILTSYPGANGALTGPANSLYLGNTTAENSLETGTTYATHSYWRLSSNSSGGATVYYSGNTLANTVGDKITPLDDASAHASLKGTEQFGLGIDHGSDTTTLPGSVQANPVDTTGDAQDTGADLTSTLDSGFASLVSTTANDAKVHSPRLYPLVPASSYGSAAGTFYGASPTGGFAFNTNANTVPVPIASENTQVVNCVTAKMRYIGNIAATTPAGIYATKINYLAAPQY